ncbi:hypothetical protein HPP92_024541 [Vanilla planifolia]|uniref:Uncharacterized protein n=1 Tax=Vanilla planifolia TaxID=51239 RepID=A0A835PT01_VANPL|nr:hypothetical protein HPP92_024541 [Vanilla planifolia]
MSVHRELNDVKAIFELEIIRLFKVKLSNISTLGTRSLYKGELKSKICPQGYMKRWYVKRGVGKVLRRRLEMQLRRRDVEKWMIHRQLPEVLQRMRRLPMLAAFCCSSFLEEVSLREGFLCEGLANGAAEASFLCLHTFSGVCS